MKLFDKMQRLPLEKIRIDRDNRQRREIDVEDLKPSIKLRGVIQPIVVEEESPGQYLLIAGERRYTASKELGLPDIPARLSRDLSPDEKQIVELEENLHRKDLPWQDYVLAVDRIHQIYSSAEEGWTQQRTGEAIGFSPDFAKSTISIILRVATEVKAANPLVLQASGYRPAYNIIARKDERAISDAMNDIMEGVDDFTLTPTPEQKANGNSAQTVTLSAKPKPLITPPEESILNQDFVEFASTYSGPKFNLIHCDFPYGIDLDKSEQAKTASYGGYDDSEETYWKLCRALCENLDRLMTPSAHLIFWLSSDIYRQYDTLEFFRVNASDLEFIPVPIVWHKTDNKGILSDPKRRPRHIYESAFIASRGDRLIIKAVSDVYGSPKGNPSHQSEKAEPMLRNFFQMFVDENTRFLDPTCGSGTSLRAAESLGATSVLGLELNPEFAETARTNLRKFRNLRALEKK